MVERAFEETTYDIWELRQQGLKNGKFSINNITNGYASKDIEILLKREEKL
ncbi:MAG: hypothetical protein LBF15_06410 [Candidatus Peribacteria bacterium]|jgi:hypothetical protein|nr:hypothetical protein [Candidatus Peribacteria bacterium]